MFILFVQYFCCDANDATRLYKLEIFCTQKCLYRTRVQRATPPHRAAAVDGSAVAVALAQLYVYYMYVICS